MLSHLLVESNSLLAQIEEDLFEIISSSPYLHGPLLLKLSYCDHVSGTHFADCTFWDWGRAPVDIWKSVARRGGGITTNVVFLS